jgi:hypothetical protein
MLITNLATQFGTLAETVELFLALALMIGGIILTWMVQKWADSTSKEQPGAVNLGEANPQPREANTMRQ